MPIQMVPTVIITAPPDTSSNPRSGAKLYSYIAGTNTPVALYREIQLNTAHANPVVADSNGVFPPVYRDTTVDYKLVLRDSSDVDIWTIANASELQEISEFPYATSLANIGDMMASNNLSDLDSVPTALTNLGIEAGATADQTGAEIKAAYEAEANTNAFTDALLAKLNGIETSATADQTGAEIKAAYEGEADTNAFTDAEKTKLAGLTSGGGGGSLTAAEVKTLYESNADTNAFTDADESKLDSIVVADLPSAQQKTILDQLTYNNVASADLITVNANIEITGGFQALSPATFVGATFTSITNNGALTQNGALNMGSNQDITLTGGNIVLDTGQITVGGSPLEVLTATRAEILDQFTYTSGTDTMALAVTTLSLVNGTLSAGRIIATDTVSSAVSFEMSEARWVGTGGSGPNAGDGNLSVTSGGIETATGSASTIRGSMQIDGAVVLNGGITSTSPDTKVPITDPELLGVVRARNTRLNTDHPLDGPYYQRYADNGTVQWASDEVFTVTAARTQAEWTSNGGPQPNGIIEVTAGVNLPLFGSQQPAGTLFMMHNTTDSSLTFNVDGSSTAYIRGTSGAQTSFTVSPRGFVTLFFDATDNYYVSGDLD